MRDPIQYRLRKNATQWAMLTDADRRERIRYHAARVAALAGARRFLAGIELKPFEPQIIADVAAEYAEPAAEPEVEELAPRPEAIAPSPRPTRNGLPYGEMSASILRYVATAGRPVTSKEISQTFTLRQQDVASCLAYLAKQQRIRHIGVTSGPGHRKNLYILAEREVQHATH